MNGRQIRVRFAASFPICRRGRDRVLIGGLDQQIPGPANTARAGCVARVSDRVPPT